MRPGFQGPVTDSTISIAELLDLVNQYFPDILPEDVLKHYGYDARPDGDLGADALYQDRADESVSNRSLLANAFEGLVQNDIEKQKIQEYKGKIELVNAEEKKLQELNAQIKDLSFAKGPRDTVKIRQLRDEATKTANRINIYDKQLLRLEASKPFQDDLELSISAQRSERDLLRFHGVKTNVVTSVCTGYSNMPPAYCICGLQIPLVAQNTHTEWCGCFVAE